ncbi:MAG TPA: hypothetical protein VL400_02800 [Polyangiaceae bacterium]|nr:hypothetical protein [Polyangiaceae bacterium]
MPSLAERWLRTVPTLRELEMRATLVTRDLDESTLGEAASALEEICALSEQADPRAREVLAALLPSLADPSRADVAAELRRAAHDEGHFALARLLRKRANQFVHEAPEPNERHPGQAQVGRALTLGERKALARRQDRFVLDRLLRDPHPAVIKNLLSNPRITEEDIVRLAARRPTFADVQSEIAKTPKWAARPRVRLALAQNPFTPPDTAVALVQLLVRPELEQVLAATDVPAVVRAAARELLERRPPIPTTEEPTEVQ